jgi:hypothetical protein
MKLFGRGEDEARMKAYAETLVEEKLARMFYYKTEIQAWEENKELVLGEMLKRQREIREMISKQQEIDDTVKKRHMTKVLLTQWREMDDAIIRQQREISNVINALISNFKHELLILTPYIRWAKREDKEKLIQGYVIVVIEDLIGIYQRINENFPKTDIFKNICEMIDIAAALDSKTVQSRSKIIKFRQDIYHVRSGNKKIIWHARSM